MIHENDTADLVPEGWLRFDDWAVPNPLDKRLHEAAWKARYDREALTQTECFRLAEAFEAYCHFMTHPAPTSDIVKQLRTVRSEIKRRTK